MVDWQTSKYICTNIHAYTHTYRQAHLTYRNNLLNLVDHAKSQQGQTVTRAHNNTKIPKVLYALLFLCLNCWGTLS